MMLLDHYRTDAFRDEALDILVHLQNTHPSVQMGIAWALSMYLSLIHILIVKITFK